MTILKEQRQIYQVTYFCQYFTNLSYISSIFIFNNCIRIIDDSLQQNMKKANILKPYKPQSSRGKSTNCEICGIKFQAIIKQEHSCKRCFRSICQKCGPTRVKVYEADGSTSVHRNCQKCLQEIEFIRNFKQNNKLCYGQDSQVIEQWMKKLNKERMPYQQIMNQYTDKCCTTSDNNIRFKSQSDRMFAELLESYNYSMRYFMCYMTEGIEVKYIKQKVQAVMCAIYAYLKDMPYVGELVYVVAFILCFCNESHCYFLVSRLIEKIYPQYLKMNKMKKEKKDNLLLNEVKVLVDMYKILAGKTDNRELELYSQYFEERLTLYIKSFTLNVCSVIVSYHILNQIFTNGSYIQFYKGITTILYMARQQLNANQNPELIEAYLLKHVNLQSWDQFKKYLAKFQKSNIKFQVETQFFDSAEHRKLHQKYKEIQSMNKKLEAKLKEQEIHFKQLLKDYEVVSKKSKQLSHQNMILQEEILQYSDKIPMLDDFNRISEENSHFQQKYTSLLEENKKLKKQLDDFKKTYQINQDKYKIYEKLEKNYIDQICNLRTKNQIYQIEMEAKKIDFNTSFIEEKLAIKNKTILDLEQKVKEKDNEIRYLTKKKDDDGYFNSSLSMIRPVNNMSQSTSLKNTMLLNLTNGQVMTKQEKDSYKRQMDISKELIEKLKAEIQETQKEKASLGSRVEKLSELYENQKKELELRVEINNFVNQIPQENDYEVYLTQLDKLMSKENNIHKKTLMESIKASFQNCLDEVKYRAIDCKLKENKIKTPDNKLNQSIMLRNLADLAQTIKLQENQLAATNQQELGNLFGWMASQDTLMEGEKKVQLSKDQCAIM